MAQINLLPWREERRQELKKAFLVTSFLVLAGAACLILLGDRVVNGQIENQMARNEYLTKNIKDLDKEVAEIRDLLGTTRKFAVPLCEYLDRVGLTRRDGDLRVRATT